jgi:hypothetical protein
MISYFKYGAEVFSQLRHVMTEKKILRQVSSLIAKATSGSCI